MGLPRCGLGYVDDNVGRYACEIVSTREISSRADQKTCIRRRGTYDLNTDKGEGGGSSPPRPTIQIRGRNRGPWAVSVRLPGVVGNPRRRLQGKLIVECIFTVSS